MLFLVCNKLNFFENRYAIQLSGCKLVITIIISSPHFDSWSAKALSVDICLRESGDCGNTFY